MFPDIFHAHDTTSQWKNSMSVLAESGKGVVSGNKVSDWCSAEGGIA